MNRLIDPAWLNGYAVTALSCSRLFTATQGAGPVLLFVHGGYHGAWCWQKFMQWFAERGQPVAALDLRGHGGLPQGDDFPAQGVLDYAADVVEAACALARPVVIVGHSLGGLVGMAAARQVAPVAQILLAPSPPGQLKGLKPLPGYNQSISIPPPDAQTAREKFLSGYDGEIDSLLPLLCPESPRAMNDRYRLRIRIEAGWVKGPTLCLSAGRDLSHLHPPGQDEATARFFGGTHVMRPDSAHDMMLDDHWKDTAAILLDWLHAQKGDSARIMMGALDSGGA